MQEAFIHTLVVIVLLANHASTSSCHGFTYINASITQCIHISNQHINFHNKNTYRQTQLDRQIHIYMNACKSCFYQLMPGFLHTSMHSCIHTSIYTHIQPVHISFHNKAQIDKVQGLGYTHACIHTYMYEKRSSFLKE